MSRTDTHLLTVSSKDGQRFSFVGSKKECEEAAALKQKSWKGSSFTIEKR